MPSSGRVISCCLSTRCNISDTSVRASIYAGLRQRVASSSTLCCPAMRVRTIGELTTTAVPLSRTAGSTLSADPCGNNFMSCAVRLALLYSVMQVACGLLLLMPMCYLTKGVFILSLLGLLQHAL